MLVNHKNLLAKYNDFFFKVKNLPKSSKNLSNFITSLKCGTFSGIFSKRSLTMLVATFFYNKMAKFCHKKIIRSNYQTKMY